MKDFWFEIFSTEDGDYGWVCFSGRRGKRRELARSSRLYKSVKKTRRAIGKVRGAGIGRPFTLPRTSFEFVPGVVPLTSREAPSRSRRGAAKGLVGPRPGPAAGPAPAPGAGTQPPATPAADAGQPQAEPAAGSGPSEAPSRQGKPRPTRTRKPKVTAQ
ncbi:hypothetical protein [Amycolatopsis sp. cg9]|uniref:hypothetical protein n=1 Tax=Amycolatopsis sp. cg9 TaxID=3238801 RepID=UPI0035253713